MRLCINPNCNNQNQDIVELCQQCGSELLID
ncbi:MAG: 4-Cys prefix domain-containing protein, partial [Pseudanabaena sp.]